MNLRIINMDKRLYKAAIFLSVFSISVSSCKKVESDVLPGDDQLNMLTDTFNVTGYSIKEDSIRTDEFSNNMLGSYNDPVFGITRASIYTEARLSVANPDFFVDGTPIVDSVVLSMKLSGHYGNESVQTFEVYQLTEKIFRDSAYYSNSVKSNTTIDLIKSGFNSFKPSMTATPIIDGETLEPQIRIRLDETFGDMIMNSGAALLTDTAFASYLKGIYITTNDVQSVDEGGIYSVDLESDDSKITIYYHNPVDTLTFDLPINDRCARFTHVDHDYTSAPAITQQLIDSIGSDYYYLQAGGGVIANLNLPNIFDLQANGNVIINKAELYMPVQHYSISPYAPPARILAFGLDDEGEIYTMPDFSYPGPTVYGGFYDDTKKAYVFNIMRYVQNVLKGDVANNAIRIVPTSSSVSVNRVILSGNNSPNREKPYIKIYYTKF
jgi:hypothetical protein